jgi:carboxypeptidase D
MYDPCIGSYSYVAEEVTAYPFVEANNNMIGINASYLATLKELDQTCGFADFREKYYKFPAAGIQPPAPDIPYEGTCDINTWATNAAEKINPCFNSYELVTQCPMPSGKLPDQSPKTSL